MAYLWLPKRRRNPYSQAVEEQTQKHQASQEGLEAFFPLQETRVAKRKKEDCLEACSQHPRARTPEQVREVQRLQEVQELQYKLQEVEQKTRILTRQSMSFRFKMKDPEDYKNITKTILLMLNFC
ncbi:Uncharacterized protein DAT39_014550 [Clarias magur]|uniref:Uncharacterized protein n=1 Tax=Clarias magur TaxID=1594786 RepID=A0A8J4XCL3_CLAMG|nr:Uncharacterized protein DAT39_014550 [Clarias magur]